MRLNSVPLEVSRRHGPRCDGVGLVFGEEVAGVDSCPDREGPGKVVTVRD